MALRSPASAEPVTGCLARGRGYGRDPDEGRELGFVSYPVWVVSDCDQELAGYFRSYTWQVTEHRRVDIEDFPERGVGCGDFCREGLAADGQDFQCQQAHVLGVSHMTGRPGALQGCDHRRGSQPPVFRPELVRG
ncbi:hypothetical protein GCM10023346_04610 [Arthrobacter gyeryongensis]|uniref:Uncharacterized protein n=1 Tax=Arthrobacter gyeryongensis TaxID=1650592 RepID=A0ABP9S254_9MICC